ncbi:MAG: M24 family metallopeptidase [Firmicutes bacterium]|nr:M24 family metallopeptidase [Bacillota bacterium]
MESQRLDGIIVSRRDNFAWLTCGGDNHVLKHTEYGFGHLLITPERQYLLAFTMDVARILEEQIPGQGYEPIASKWHQGDPRTGAFGLAGKNIASDAGFPGTKAVDIQRVHGPLSELELDRSRWLGHQTALILEEIARWVRPGMSESEIGRQLHSCLVLDGIEPEVIIVGSDDRLERYWHALPSPKRLEKYALIHSASSRWGLHANVNRLVSLGEPPRRIRDAHRAAVTIEGQVLGMLENGVAYSSILQHQKNWYSEMGYPDEWELHFQGGPTGYFVGDPTRCWTDMLVESNQAFDWFITVGGVQVEELVLLTEYGLEVASMGSTWPRTSVSTEKGKIVIPDIYIL